MNHQLGQADLHTHTTASDGLNSPADNVQMARDKGLSAIAITDHDTVAGVDEALEAGEKLGIMVVPGIEISTGAEDTDIHVLGYFLNHQDPVLKRRLRELRNARERRNEAILEKLNQLGIPLSLKEVLQGLGRKLQEGESLGRPHLAAALVAKGYAADIRDAFDRYLAEGAAAYANVPRITPQEAFAWIREAGGAPVIAHPGIYGQDALVQSILESGRPSGIEVFHSDHSPEDERRYGEWAAHYGLIPTGGSDFHGSRNGTAFHGELGSRTVSMRVVQLLKEV
ncbi:metal-dependent phosphoesterase [Paenibacillus yonginensis]|uniref:Metal-dependent phosphoesterase n=1 Tax=Paenibacillus yonginensis TaxID=1462996 RepID=A0A1B1N0P7_9BACL|nr:PHP domain-containing protein [Paenibacillus yonginensis]ANS75007.1 metal-dependent phosphoesterase [Paenibacillus yonginensis]